MARLIAEAALIQGVGTPVQEIIGRLNTETDEVGPDHDIRVPAETETLGAETSGSLRGLASHRSGRAE